MYNFYMQLDTIIIEGKNSRRNANLELLTNRGSWKDTDPGREVDASITSSCCANNIAQSLGLFLKNLMFSLF
jgi:hypothetical protein